MAEIINLRQVRKAQKRKQADATASANRAKFGQTKAERNAQTAETQRAARLLDGAKREHD
ncbi:DUF4169 family protein [Blastomonas sp.]|uniref:DUF4169 family protein n=1 Tax=Blastomonas sp. TaxID=1909299 RepID=UPI00262A0A8D|nr:DUF4169 family protein [Blastomonas sp.]MDM7956360.1 DUF4169 family protein [Blastomonas sp.]